ncbi:allatostatin-A receptor-like [Oculina patagonica]
MAISTSSLVYAVCLAAMIIFNIAGNSLVCLIILKKKAMKTSINWLLFHLAIADLLVAVFFIPPCILSHFIEQPGGLIGDMLCKFITGGNLGWGTASASSFLLVVIAFERYNATVRPFKRLKRRRSAWLVPGLWILSILLTIPGFVVSTYDVESQACVQKLQEDKAAQALKLTWFFASSGLPICIIAYLYARIITCLFNRVHVPSSCPNSSSLSRNKVTKMLISVSVIYILCWIPPLVLSMLSFAIPGGYATVHSVATASALLNSCLNPLVYTLHSQQFRKSLASLVYCCKSK